MNEVKNVTVEAVGLPSYIENVRVEVVKEI